MSSAVPSVLGPTLVKRTEDDEDLETKCSSQIKTIAAGLRSMYIKKHKLRSGSFFKVEPRPGVNFDRLECYDVYVESKKPELIKQPFETYEQAHGALTSTIILKDNLAKFKVSRLTAIQKFVFPNILEGQADLLISAPTGSGKSFSYITAICQIVTCLMEREYQVPKRPPKALVLAPTRELVLQIFQQAIPLIQDTGVRVLYLYGHKDIEKQIQNINLGTDIIISTPGRMIHLVEAKVLKLHNIRYFVIDEIDKVLFPQAEANLCRMSIGSRIALATDFNQQTLDWIYKLFGKSSPDPSNLEFDYRVNKPLCRNFFFSATIDGRIRLEAEKYLAEDYVYMIMGDQVRTVSSDIKQIVLPCKNYTEKKIELIKLLKSLYIKYSRIIIFVSERIMADTLSDYLNMNGFTTVSIHGNRLQEHREMVIRDFRKGHIRLVVTTFLLSRGIDVEGLNCVINFDFPDSITEYIHAIGRTGRMGNTGLAISFFNTTLKQDLNLVNEMVQVLQQSSQTVPQFLLDIQSQLI